MTDADATRKELVGAERWWEGIATLAAAAAGVGLFLIVMGAAIVWIRLEAVGLPADVGLAMTPKADLAALGFRKLLFPAIVNAGIFFVGARWIDRRREARAVALSRGEPVRPSRFERAWSWLMSPSRRRWLIALPLVPIAALAAFLERTGLWVVWWLIWWPLSWYFVVWTIAMALSLSYTDRVMKAIPQPVTRHVIDRTRLKVAASLALASAVPALAGQLDKPVELQRAAVWMTDGDVRIGYYVASLPQGVVIGADGRITEIPRRRIEKLNVEQAPPSAKHPSLVERALDAVRP